MPDEPQGWRVWSSAGPSSAPRHQDFASHHDAIEFHAGVQSVWASIEPLPSTSFVPAFELTALGRMHVTAPMRELHARIQDCLGHAGRALEALDDGIECREQREVLRRAALAWRRFAEQEGLAERSPALQKR